MKNIIRSFAILLPVTFLFSGCFAVHNGMITGTASLTSANFTIVENQASGKSGTTMFIFVGGMDKHHLVNDAKNNLLKKHPLKKNQALANVTVDFKTSVYLGLLIFRECYVIADIVEFY